MPSRLSGLSPSDTKARFVKRLGLDKPDKQHLYALMKIEAIDAWQRLQRDRSALSTELWEDEGVQVPFPSSQISETAMHQAVMRVYRTASPETRAVYELEHDNASLEEDNWVIRWLLWHVFRYRDQRHKKATSASTQAVRSMTRVLYATVDAAVPQASTPLSRQESSVSSAGPPHYPFDPVRDC